jgi:FixJ family two-component response regulator
MTGTVAIIDDDEAVGRSLLELLQAHGLACMHFLRGADFLVRNEEFRFACIVLDVRIPGMDGLEVQSRLRQCGNDIPLIFITGHADVPLAVKAMRAGAYDFLEKPIDDELLVDSIRSATDSRARVRPDGDVRRQQFADRLNRLSRRERQVMELVVRGYSSNSIGTLLSISSRTVDHHRAHILEKMEIPTLAALIRTAAQHGFADSLPVQ